ncbi:WD40-repeat-containing domain protein [Diplogelasinospora grovesii]|uniref:WD40-repeat-containing domain protein n=1 Tax=Diplogelasinospora grovesii TaxID=303347 RepID=A0AAN6NHY8_9PEZI|nr:WD40-repeat-containing domain protein [Diplogelasinospora grovesii]
MYMLSCTDGYEYPSEPGSPTYVLEVMPVAAGLAAIASDQSLCLFDPLRLNQGPIRKIRTNHGNLTCAKAYSVAESTVATTGEDGTVSFWDLRINDSNAQVHRIGGGGPSLLSLARAGQTDTLATGTELSDQLHQASIQIWDLRSAVAPKVQYDEVHSDDVTELVFHPENPALLLSGSTDGLVNICDTRISDEDEVVIQAFNHGSIHHAGFLNTTEVYALSHDEKFALYDMAEDQIEKGAATQDFGDARAQLQCQYVANVFPKLNGAGAIIGAGSQDKELFQLIHLSRTGVEGVRWNFDAETVVGLPGAHGNEIVRSFCFYDEHQLAITAGEDGCIKAWRPSS